MSTQQGATHRFGIGARMAALVCAMVALTCLAGGAWTYLNLSRRLVEQELGGQRGVIEAAAAQLTAGVEALSHDTAFLADLPAVQGIVRCWEHDGIDPVGRIPVEVWKDRLAAVFEAKMRSAPQYFQVRLIGQQDGGREIIRVERVGGGIEVVPHDKLQRKGDRPYFQEATHVPPGSVYLSDIELNQEWGQIVRPEIPVLRAATSVRLSDGRLFGILAINKDMRLRFGRMREPLAGHYALYLFDERGALLMYSRPDGEYVLPVGPLRLEDRFPEARNLLASREAGQGVATDTATGERVVATVKTWHYDPTRPGRYYGLMLTSSYEAAIAPSLAERNRAAWFGFLLLAVTVTTMLLASRKITRPLREITQAVEYFAKGKADLKLPMESGDEAGTLARAFRRMAWQVRDQRAALEAEVGERRRAEESLRESEQQLRLALDAAQAGIWIFDAHANVNVWDERLERMFGLEPNTFAGSFEAWVELVHPEDRQQAIAETRRALEEKHLYEGEFRAGRGGRWRHIKSQAVVLRDGEGKPAKMIGVCWDITDDKVAQSRIQHYASQLERKNQEMEQFVYSVSHDLKAPLVTCKGFLGILREEFRQGNTEQAMEALERVERAAQQMSRLIDDLLQFSRVGRATNNPEPLETSALAREVSQELRQQWDAGDVRIEIQDEMPVILADPTAVSRLFQNLIGNAFKYGLSGPQPRIEVGGHVSGSEVRFFVRDNGAGIPKEYQHKIFGLFQRLDTTQEGTGIGLAVVSKIMELHGGRVWVESDSQQGTVFWLAFPLRLLAPAPAPLTRSLA